MVRSSCGRLSCIRFIKSRNLVSVRAVVAICWRKLAMKDYSPQTARGDWLWNRKKDTGAAFIIAFLIGLGEHSATIRTLLVEISVLFGRGGSIVSKLLNRIFALR